MRAQAAIVFEGAALIGGRPAYVIAREMRRVVEREHRLNGGGRIPPDLAEALAALEQAGGVWSEYNRAAAEAAEAAEGPAGSVVVDCDGCHAEPIEVTTQEAAFLLGVGVRRVRQLLLGGQLSGRRTKGNQWLIDRAHVAEYQRSRYAR